MKLSRLTPRLPTQIASLLRTICITLIFSAAWAQAQTPAPVYDEEGWRLAVPGWEYTFPTDHGTHDEFQTEWWYFTGNLKEKGGTRRFSYQLTFFPARHHTPAKIIRV